MQTISQHEFNLPKNVIGIKNCHIHQNPPLMFSASLSKRATCLKADDPSACRLPSDPRAELPSLSPIFWRW